MRLLDRLKCACLGHLYDLLDEDVERARICKVCGHELRSMTERELKELRKERR